MPFVWMFFFRTIHPVLSQVWAESFGAKLALREESHHAQCGVCTRHKLLLRKLSGDRQLRNQQMKAYSEHLQRQYDDRVQYWAARTRSRIPVLPDGEHSICLIIDGQDHNKYRYPRDTIFQSKELSGCIRPCMDATAVIAHGYGILMALSEPFVRKDSSWSCELIAYVVNQISETSDIRKMELICQADNTSREVKNNTLTRMAGYLIGSRRLKRMELRFLQSGHSHEDVDAWFSVLSNLLESKKHLETPEDFQQVLQEFLVDPKQRPHEQKFREVKIVNSIRNWIFDCKKTMREELNQFNSSLNFPLGLVPQKRPPQVPKSLIKCRENMDLLGTCGGLLW